MSVEKTLRERSENKCELCGAQENLGIYSVPPVAERTVDKSIYACSLCAEQMDNPDKVNANHWRCLNESMWSEVPAVQVMAWRMLNRLRAEGWPADLLENMYLDEDTLKWAKADGDGEDGTGTDKHKDSNGNILQTGDSVTLIKNLDVKGANFTAKRGTAVRNISLVADNVTHIEGKVNGQQIVILTEFVKKTS